MDSNPNPLVVIIDDEPNVGQALADFLDFKGIRTHHALSGKAGLEVIAHERPALVILDVMMPGMNGLDVLQQIKKDFPDVVVVMLTGVYDEKTARESIKRGAYEYLTKPLDFNALESLVKRLLG